MVAEGEFFSFSHAWTLRDSSKFRAKGCGPFMKDFSETKLLSTKAKRSLNR